MLIFYKICVFCDKYCFRIDICVFIIIKIKYMNLDKINDICDKYNFIIKIYIFYNI